MTDFTQQDQSDFFDPSGNGQRAEEPEELFSEQEAGASYVNYDALFDAPDYSTMVKGTRSKTAREYELKIKSILKSGAVNTLRRGNMPDSAAIFRHGPAFSAAAGDLADVSEQTRKMIDLLTAPENPYVMFALTAIPFVAQLFRNHQPEIHQVNVTRKEVRKYRKEHPEESIKQQQEDRRKNVTLHLPLGRTLNFRVGLRFNPLKGLRFALKTQTREPAELVTMVFSDKKLVAALKKMDIDIVQVKV